MIVPLLFSLVFVILGAIVGTLLYCYYYREVFSGSASSKFTNTDILKRAKRDMNTQVTVPELQSSHTNLAWCVHDLVYASSPEKLQCGVYLIEGRSQYTNIELALENIRTVLPDCDIVFIGSKTNTEHVQKNLLQKNERAVCVPKLTSVDDFSSLIGSTRFWNTHVQHDRALITQIDARLCHNPLMRLEDYFAYDYVGAPWYAPEGSHNQSVGNSGFFLANPQAMVHMLTKHPYTPGKIPVDVHFANHLRLKPSAVVARAFAVENLWHPRPIGVHQPFVNDRKMLQHLAVHCGAVNTINSPEAYL